MFLKKQHHIAIISSSYEKAKEFYIDKLGFELVKEAYRPAQNDYLRMLRKGDTVLELFIRPDAPQRPNNPEAMGLRHLAFRVEDIEPVVAWLNAMGIEKAPDMHDANPVITARMNRALGGAKADRASA